MTLLALDAEPIPVAVLTGFLGSGKTTVLRHWLDRPDMGETAAIVNEFGEVGLDHALLETSEEDTLLLDNGCLCCGLRGDLADTLMSLLDRRERGETPAFRRVAIETTGLADPVPLLQTFRTDPLRLSRFAFDGLVTCYDAVNGARSVADRREAARQVALADTIIVTKTDLGDAAQARAEIARLNPRAVALEAVHGAVDPGRALNGAARPVPPVAEGEPYRDVRHVHGRIASVSAFGNEALDWNRVRRAVADLVEAHGDRLLRLKGLLKVEGREGPVGVDGVRHLFHRPRPMEAWPAGIARPFLVGIAEDASPGELRGWLRAVLSPGDPRQAGL